jgi:hypothetical protein
MTLTINDATMTSDRTPTPPGTHPAGTDGKCPGSPAAPWTATPPSPR